MGFEKFIPGKGVDWFWANTLYPEYADANIIIKTNIANDEDNIILEVLI
jgi:hypothetical protein